MTCLAIYLVLLSAADNLDTSLGVWYHNSGGTHRIGTIGERETHAVAEAEDVMANSYREIKATENGVHERKEFLKKARHALDRLCQSVSTMLEATVMGYEVEVSGQRERKISDEKKE